MKHMINKTLSPKKTRKNLKIEISKKYKAQQMKTNREYNLAK